jgi:hypothetical protein
MIGARLQIVLAGLRDERGQSIVEWLGATAVCVVLVVILAAVKPSFGDQLRCAVGAQVERIMTIDQKGDCKMGDSKVVSTRATRSAPRVAEQDRQDRQALRPSQR